jgi:hypothetical protein
MTASFHSAAHLILRPGGIKLCRSTWDLGIFAACMIAVAAVLLRIVILGAIAAAAPNESKLLCRFAVLYTSTTILMTDALHACISNHWLAVGTADCEHYTCTDIP